MSNAASLSNSQMDKMLPFARKDVHVEPNAKQFFTDSNRLLESHIKSTPTVLEMAVVEQSILEHDQDIEEVNTARERERGRERERNER